MTKFLLLSTFFFALPGNGWATVVYSDTFNRANSALLGTSPDIGGVWTITGTSVVSPLSINANEVNLVTTGQDAYSTLSSPTAPALYTSISVKVTAAQTTGDYFFHLSDPAGTTSNFYQRLSARSGSAGTYTLGITSGAGTGAVITSGAALNLGQTYQVVIAWNPVSGPLNDFFDIYVDPLDPVEANNTPYIDNAVWSGTNAEPTQIAAVNLRQGTGSAAPTLVLDNLKVATSFGEVVVPEPMTSAFLLAGLGLQLCRRSRSRRV